MSHINDYFKSMKSVLRACNNSIGNDEEIIDALTESDKLNKSLQGEYYDFSQVYATDMIKPFEDRMAQGKPEVTTGSSNTFH